MSINISSMDICNFYVGTLEIGVTKSPILRTLLTEQTSLAPLMVTVNPLIETYRPHRNLPSFTSVAQDPCTVPYRGNSPRTLNYGVF